MNLLGVSRRRHELSQSRQMTSTAVRKITKLKVNQSNENTSQFILLKRN